LMLEQIVLLFYLKMERFDVIQITCRDDKKIHLPRKEILNLIDQDWFLALLVSNNFGKETENCYSIWEDFNHVMSLIESLRYNELIILESVSLDYLECLADKWCAPEWLKDKIKEKKKEIKLGKNITNINDLVFKCEVCDKGFKNSENTKYSCRTHTYGYSSASECFSCCGNGKESKYCKVGYHISSILNNKLLELNNSD